MGIVGGEKFADRVLDDVVDDVGRCVVDTAGFANLGFFFDFGVVGGREGDDLSEEALVDASEDVGGDDRKFVGAFGIVEAADDGLEGGIIDIKRWGEGVGRFVSAFFDGEME